jgi:hypothetical protein
MSVFCRQRRPSPASCAGLQSRQLLAHAGDARADQGLVVDEPKGKADQDRREGREPRSLRRIPDGRGCYPEKSLRRHPAAHRATAAAARCGARMKRSCAMRSRPNPQERCVLITARSASSGVPRSILAHRKGHARSREGSALPRTPNWSKLSFRYEPSGECRLMYLVAAVRVGGVLCVRARAGRASPGPLSGRRW